MFNGHAFESIVGLLASIVVGGEFSSFDELQNSVRQFEQENLYV